MAENYYGKCKQQIIKSATDNVYCGEIMCSTKVPQIGIIHPKNWFKQGDPSSLLFLMLFVNDIIENINTDTDGIFTENELQLF